MADNHIKLSILICSVNNEDRQSNLKKILHELNVQISKNYAENMIEVIVEKDNGEMSVGQKRNLLIKKSKGEYICFIDDDDFISFDYLEKILENLKGDILTIRIKHIVNGIESKPIQPSLYIDNLETNDVIFKTNHFHLCPHLREKAIEVMFREINFAEDMDYSQKLVKYIQNYEQITDELYIYNDNLNKSLTRNVF